MNLQQFEGLVRDNAVGKEFSAYGGAAWSAVSKAVDAFGAKGVVYIDQDNQDIYLKVAGYQIGKVTIRKQKGDKHHNWYGSYCDWTIRDVEATFYGEPDLQAAIDKALDAKKAAEAAEAAKNAKALKLWQYLKDAGYNETEADEVLRAAYANRYEFGRKVFRP